MHKVRRRRQLAVVRELWQTRDRIAQRRDVSPGKVLSDAAIVEAALSLPADVQALAALNGFGHRMGRRQLEQWQVAVDRAKALPDSALPQPGQPVTGPPPPRAWADKDPEAAARLSAARAAVSAVAEGLNMPQENLITRTPCGGSAGSRRSMWTWSRWGLRLPGTGLGLGRLSRLRRFWWRL